MCLMFFFFFKQKTAYEMRISDWSSDVCSSDLRAGVVHRLRSRRDRAHRRAHPGRRRGAAGAGFPGEAGADAFVPAAQCILVCADPVAGRPGDKVLSQPEQVSLPHRLPHLSLSFETQGIGRTNLWTPITKSQPVFRLLLEKKK